MNRLTIIGNLTRDPETRTTQTGKTVCSFTVAVNRRGQDQGADYFRVSAWEKLGENCQKYLAKGRKAAVMGAVSARVYTTQDGEARASLEVTASEVEFLTARAEQAEATASGGWEGPRPQASGTQADRPQSADAGSGRAYLWQEVTDDDLPF